MIMSSVTLKSNFLIVALKKIAHLRLSLFLILCVVFGGTSQDVIAPKLVLYLISLIVIGGCLSFLTRQSRLWKIRSLFYAWLAFFVAHLIYLIPLPPSIWTKLPGRDSISHGFEVLGTNLPWLPMSVSPENTFFSLFNFLPPLAVILLFGTIVRGREIIIALWMLTVSVILLVVLGLSQVSISDAGFHFYNNTNLNSAVGFFSNANHFGIFLLMCIPIIGFFADYHRKNAHNGQNGVVAFCYIAILSALLGIGASGSLASYLLIIPVIVGTLFLSSSGTKRKQIYLIGLGASLVLAIVLDIFVWNGLQSELIEKLTTVDKNSRQIMFENTYNLGDMFFPFGSGPRSFEDAYRLVEVAGYRTIPHAHNEYVEVFAEFGILGLAGILAVILWLGKTIVQSIRAAKPTSNIGKFLCITVSTVLVHSLVDYSLRTITVMTLLCFCLCIILLVNKDVQLFED